MTTEDTPQFEQFKEQVLKDGPRLGPDDTFQFECHSGLKCFNHCCHDVNIFITPYDVLRLKNRLGISSGDFLDRYCVIPFSKSQKYPVVMLKMGDDKEKTCPMLNAPEGCSVYEDRPWACRMYPLGRAAPPPTGEEDEAFYFLVKEDFCLGGETGPEITVAQWLRDQGVEDYDLMGRAFQEIAQHERLQDAENVLSPQAMDMLFMVCYDLDRLRRFVFESKFLDMFQIADETIEAARADDEALMQLGFDWIRFALWHEPTMKIRDEVVEAKKATLGAEKE